MGALGQLSSRKRRCQPMLGRACVQSYQAVEGARATADWTASKQETSSRSAHPQISLASTDPCDQGIVYILGYARRNTCSGHGRTGQCCGDLTSAPRASDRASRHCGPGSSGQPAGMAPGVAQDSATVAIPRAAPAPEGPGVSLSGLIVCRVRGPADVGLGRGRRPGPIGGESKSNRS